ncbi:hypothetical protein [Luteimonas aquatica]|uniref:hypothetical protein n=1 Tax=Luteimonas aquatica TaxID=450364 RepID=UPI001F563B13|nr:hypothetical protein [Luteimonas aquatica]
MPLPRWSLLLCCLLLAAAPTAPCQDRTAWISGEWQPDTEQNDRLFEQAREKFKEAVQEARQERRESGETRGPRRGGKGGGRGGMGRRGGRPHGDRRSGESPDVSLAGLLPAELAFAAPTEGSLILQRTRESVLFGRGDREAVVFLPLAGRVGLGNGIQAALREENGQLMLQADMPSGRRAYYRYAETPDGLRVEISIDGQLPGGSVQVQRVYRRVRVDVGAPQKTAR